ncbi:MAG: hypothetical protein IJB79_03475 [Candidatus Gastranaerophilales bacterium]|nr:hypothetical protein [Candidatus Gastranaerophilales bacterium]
MDNEINKKISCDIKNNKNNQFDYTLFDALIELDELKKIALNCFDKNGNPNLSIALKAVESKAKLAGLYNKTDKNLISYVQMNDIRLDGEQLKLNIGENFLNEGDSS